MPGFNIGKDLPACNVQIGDNSNNIIPNTIETARSNRFELSLSIPVSGSRVRAPFGDKITTLACETISRPIVRIEKESVYNGADYINVPLRAKYEPIEVSIYEILNDSLASSLGIPSFNEYNRIAEETLIWWTRGAFDPYGSRVTYPQSRRTVATITMLSSTGTPIWYYNLHRAWPEAIMPDGLDYKTGSISKLKMTLVFDKLHEINPYDLI